MSTTAETPTSFIGINPAGSKIRAAIVSANGQVLEQRETVMSADKLVEQVAHLVSELRTINPEIAAVGIGLPGLVNRQTDRVIA